MSKKKIFSIFILAATISYSQWTDQNSGVNFAIRDICFVDSLFGWCVGEGKGIIATTNGGENWTTIYTLKDTVELKYVQFFDRNIGFIGGNIVKIFPGYEVRQAIIMRTGDGGFTWESISAAFDTSFSFGSARFLNEDTGWVSINNIGETLWNERKGVLLKTTDGGASWRILREDNNYLLIGAFAFSDVDHGYSFWGPFFDNFDPTFIYKTSDGGNNWLESGSIQALVGMAKSIHPDKVWAISLGGLWVSSDAGINWEDCILPQSQTGFFPLNLEMLDSNNIYLVGGVNGQPDLGRLYISNNAGKNWIIDLELPDNLFLSIALVNKRKAWIGGLNGLIMHTDNILTNITPENEVNPETYNLEQNYPNPFNPTTTIKYAIPTVETPYMASLQHVTLKIYDVLGREVATLVNETQPPGIYEVIFDADKYNLTSGIYFYQIRTNDPSAGSGQGFVQSKKMVLLR
ncbi:MAG: T9SS type A sorting domain-containing protein [bacterium]